MDFHIESHRETVVPGGPGDRQHYRASNVQREQLMNCS
jgi:hypothetical protein